MLQVQKPELPDIETDAWRRETGAEKVLQVLQNTYAAQGEKEVIPGRGYGLPNEGTGQ